MALFGGSKGKMDMEPASEDLWIDYSLAAQRVESEFEKERAAARSRLSAGGAAEGDESWNLAMSNIDTQYQQRMQSLQASEPYQILQNRFGSLRQMASAPTRLAEYGDDSQQTVNLYAKSAQSQLNRARQSQGLNPLAGTWSSEQRGTADYTRPGVTMEQFYESQYGRPEYVPEPEPTQQAPAENPGAQRARRGAAGGSSPWW